MKFDIIYVKYQKRGTVMIGEQIKKYRAMKGISQEELGRTVGVTTQAVSKWERGGVPDAELVPSIAKALGVTTDMLYGLCESSSIENAIVKDLSMLEKEARFRRAFLYLYAIGTGVAGYANEDPGIKEEDIENIRNETGLSYYSRMCVDEGIIDARMNTDSRYFFMMGEPESGLAKFMENTDALVDVFTLFSDKDILKILSFMYSRQNFPVALSVIASKTGLGSKKTEALMTKLCEHHLVFCSVIETEHENIKTYTFYNETVVIPLLCFAREISDINYLNWSAWFDRQKPLF